MSTSFNAGKAAGTPHDPRQAALDSTGGRAAPAGESGPEGISGAPPSNTAPYNSKNIEEKGFRLLRVAVDSLYLSFSGVLHDHVLVALKDLKTLAQSEQPEVQAQAQYVLASHVFEVKDKGAGVFPFVLDDNAYRIQLSRPGKKLPMAYVKVSAEYLAHKGPRVVLEELKALLADLGKLTGIILVSRVDLAADFVSAYLMDSWDRSAWVTRASEIQSHSKDQHFTGWSIGMGGVIAARLYDKTREIIQSGKDWAMLLWLPAGWKSGETVWRLEFELKREVLKQLQLSSLESVLDHLTGLWRYASTQWLRLTVPNPDDATRSRWPTHPLWESLASVDWQSPSNVLLARFSNTRPPEEWRLVSVAHGALTSYMAMYGLDDPNLAVQSLLRSMHAHYSSIAANDGMTYSQFVARRIAVKARGFNTAINEAVLSAELKHPKDGTGAAAYRGASRGE